MKISTNILKEKLKIVKTAIPSKSVNAAMECALVKDGRIYGSNNVIFISTSIDLDGEFLIPRRAIDIINCSHTAETEFIITDKTLSIKLDKSISKFSLLNANDYAEIPKAESEEIHTLSADKFDFMNGVSYASAVIDERPIYKSVLFGNEIVALDGTRVAVAKDGVDFKCVIPSTAFKVLSLLKGDNINFSQNKSKLFFDDGNISIAVSGIIGEFMDYHQIIPKPKYKIEIDRNELLEKLEMINVAVSDKHKSPLNITIANNEFQMKITDGEFTFEDSMSINADFEFSFKINARFLYDAVNSFDYDFEMRFDTAKKPIILENESQIAIVVPML